MLITEEYRALNRQLHEKKGTFGAHGDRWAKNVQEVAVMMNSTSILDYGCGAGALARSVPLPIREYDPCIDGKDAPPLPADLVVCTDVLEHIEPECLDEVLDHLQALTLRILFAVVHCGPATGNLLPDGTNPHRSQHPMPWWIDQINRRFVIAQSQILGAHTLWIMARSLAEHERIITASKVRVEEVT